MVKLLTTVNIQLLSHYLSWLAPTKRPTPKSWKLTTPQYDGPSSLASYIVGLPKLVYRVVSSGLNSELNYASMIFFGAAEIFVDLVILIPKVKTADYTK